MRYSNFFLLAAQLAAASPFQPGSSNNVARNAQVSYDGYHVYSITPSSNQAARDLEKRFSKYHTHPIRNTLSVAIPPEEVDDFHALGLDARLVNPDLGEYIRSTEKQPVYKRDISQSFELPDLSWFDTYHSYVDHLQYWDDLVAAFPNNTEKFAIGQSYENRTIWAFSFFGDKETKEEKPVILWHATVHAREWISTMGAKTCPYPFPPIILN